VLTKHEMMILFRGRFLSRYPPVNWHSKSTMFRAGLILAIILASAGATQSQTVPPRDLTQFSLEDLMNVQVTSVSKKEQKLSKAGAAIYVINQEDIRRSGATNIPDLLRMVPGVHVAQINGHTWAISIRGFTDKYGDKVLVMIDGRSVYTPLTSGVNWDQQDVPLEDIERIEVIRGPGGTVWGANAVNGVINIITKNSNATLGGLIRAGAGAKESLEGLIQYGGRIDAKGTYRVFGDYTNLGNAPAPTAQAVTDGWHKTHAGFRSDWDLSPRDKLTVQGDLFKSREAQTLDTLIVDDHPREAVIDDQITVAAGNVLGRWDHTLVNGSSTSLQVYYDRNDRVERGLGETRNTADVDFQHHLTMGSRNTIVWGGGYRVTTDSLTPGYAVRYQPDRRTDNLFSTFVQDEIGLTRSLSLTVGTKLEHNSYIGLEYEPSAQLVWNLTDRQALWASVSRAIRQPARADSDIRVDVALIPLDQGGGIGIVELTGNPSRKAEQLYDFEIGYRAQVTPRLSLDITTFSSYYHGLQTQEPQDPFFTTGPSPSYTVLPFLFSDNAHAHNYGAEVFANWNVTRRWRISPGYNYIQMHVAGDLSSQDPNAGEIANESPKHQFQIRSFLNLTRRLEWDGAVYQVGRLKDGGYGPTPSYTRLDSRLGWRLGESLNLSIVGQNLLSPAHAEYHDAFSILHSLAARSFFAKITWRF
jgi:iron complex outermembrane receptor protein